MGNIHCKQIDYILVIRYLIKKSEVFNKVIYNCISSIYQQLYIIEVFL